eukprot:GHVL01043706.1.p1 GENE.GHVL01043706.1~~GHVL01043706.1.p1  ORF type:complete len:292 (-),score=84.52 GHVL01043706.1:138-1013(-)
MMINVNLTSSEALRCYFIVEDSISKLEFLSNIPQKEEDQHVMGNEMSEMLSAETELQSRFRDLLSRRQKERSEQELDDLKTKINETTKELKSCDRDLMRNLRQTPDIEGNRKRVRDEVKTVIQLFKDLVNEVENKKTFHELASYVEKEQKNMEKLEEIRKLEKGASLVVFELTKQVEDEESELRKNILEGNEEIARLRNELIKTKIQSSAELAFRRREVTANKQSIIRQIDYERQILENELNRLENIKNLEILAQEQTQLWFNESQSKLEKVDASWETKNKEASEELAKKI